MLSSDAPERPIEYNAKIVMIICLYIRMFFMIYFSIFVSKLKRIIYEKTIIIACHSYYGGIVL